MHTKRIEPRLKRRKRIHVRIRGTAERPRVTVYRSLKNLFASIVDDESNRTLFSLSTMDKEIKQKSPKTGNVKAAEYFAEVFARRLKEKGITRLVFDRCGYLYHGRVKVFADALRKQGLEF